MEYKILSSGDSNEHARDISGGPPMAERETDDVAWFADAKRQVEYLVSSGMETAGALARNAGEMLDAEVTDRLKRIQAEAFEAVRAFALGRYGHLSNSARSTLAEAARWALARLNEMEALTETSKDRLVIRRIAEADLGDGGLEPLIKIAGELRECGLEQNEGIIQQWLDAVWRKGASREHFSTMLAYWRSLPGDALFSKRMARRLVQQYAESPLDEDDSFRMESRDFLSVAPDLYLAGEGRFEPWYLPDGMCAIDVFELVRTSGNQLAMARFKPDFFQPDEFSRVRGDVFRAYVCVDSPLLFEHLASFDDELRALTTNERNDAIERSIRQAHVSEDDWIRMTLDPFVTERHVRTVFDGLRGRGITNPLAFLSKDDRCFARLVPKIANALGATRGDRLVALQEMVADHLDLFRLGEAHFALDEEEKRLVDKEIARLKHERIVDRVMDGLVWEQEQTRRFAAAMCRRMINAGKNPDHYFLTARSTYDDGLEASGGDWNTGTRTRVLESIFASDLRPFAENILDDFSPKVLAAFVERASGVGIVEAANHFVSLRREWERHPENRFAILEEFLLDARELELAAAETYVSNMAEEDAIELPEAKEGTVAVSLEIPSLRYDPSWYDQGRAPTYGPSDDDTDYHLPSAIKPVENLPAHTFADVRALHQAMRSRDLAGMRPLVERLVGLGEIPPEKLERICAALLMVADAWNGTTADDGGELIGNLQFMEREFPLPRSADAFFLRHELFGKRRRVSPFVEVFRGGPLTEFALACAVQASRVEPFDPSETVSQVFRVETEARRQYASVRESGVPVFRDFIRWLDEEHRKHGDEYAGEFYVGRDMLSTLHLAATSARWGRMSGEARRKMTVHVDVSRTLLSNMLNGADSTGETRAMFRTWLEQEGVTERMVGIDGGYRGSAPAGVFNALSGTLVSAEKMDDRIRLVEATSSPNMRFNPRKKYAGTVTWMEALPKFTQRSKSLSKTGFGKYYVVTERRSPAERAVAWAVRQAVWRELLEPRVIDRSPV